MAFSSLTFLCFFLPLTALAYFVIPRRGWRNGVLLLASLLFYAWAEPKFLLLLVAAALVAWLAGLALSSVPAGKGKTAVFVLALVLLAGNLFCFKYLNFAADNLGALLGRDIVLRQLALPAGISFYTFQLLSYVIDVFRGSIPAERRFSRLLLFTCLFPQLIVGPILRYGELGPQLSDRSETVLDAAAGLRRFTLGLAKKVLISGGVAELAELIYAGNPKVFGSAMYWLAAISYALQIYFDFSGYSDMAIGLGRVFGFRIPENFNYPYTALSVTDFWRRWHISLSAWFRDYIYIPLGGNRVKKSRWVLNLLIVWGLTGFWHGAQWNFLLWGLYYGLLLAAEKLWLGKLMERLPKLLRWFCTGFVVVVGWVLFNRTGQGELGFTLAQMFRFAPTDWIGAAIGNTDLFYGLIWLPLGIVCMLPLGKLFPDRDGVVYLCIKDLFCVALLLVCIAFLLSGNYNSFIYFRF